MLTHSRDFPLHLSSNDRIVPGVTLSTPLLGARDMLCQNKSVEAFFSLSFQVELDKFLAMAPDFSDLFPLIVTQI